MQDRAQDLLTLHPRWKVAMILGVDESELDRVTQPTPMSRDDLVREVRRLYDTGMTPTNIAIRLGIQYKRVNDFRQPEKKARQLRAKGWSLEEIARMVVWPVSQVKALFND